MTCSDISVHIVAGFLGAGKTTFINKLFSDGLDARSTVLIENELGDVSVDDELVQAGDLAVRTLTSGCVCCSLRGDLADTIETVAGTFAPKTILIEPTGVASPNELIRICTNDLWNLPLNVESVTTLVNAQTAEEMLGMDIGVFEEQLRQARLVVLSRTQFMEPNEVQGVCKVLRDFVGWHVPIIDAPWSELDALEMLGVAQEAYAHAGGFAANALADLPAGTDGGGHGGHDNGLSHDGHDHAHDHNGHDHAHHRHGHGGSHHEHVHRAGGMESFVVNPEEAFDQGALESLASRLRSGSAGEVFRAKGFLRSAQGGMVHVEYVSGNMQVYPSDYERNPKLVVIGRNLEGGLG